MDSRPIATYLRLAAPLQSWAGARVTGNIVRTGARPSHDGLRGLVAAGLGAHRGAWPEWLQDLQFSIRVDKRGSLVDEFQTINPHDENLEFQQRMHFILTRKKWSKSASFTPDGQNLTSIVRRTYLAGAEFVVEVSGSEHSNEVADALRRPKFVPYLGRKAFAPVFPYFLGAGEPGMLDSLPTLNRLHSPKDDEGVATLTVEGVNGREFVTVSMLSLGPWLSAVRRALPLA